jgi:Na+/H+ antiporter NhaD/arsenite permease-like protein
MDWLALGVFLVVYLGMFLGGIPGLALDRTGIAVLGAIVLLASTSLTEQQALDAIDFPTLGLLLGLMVVSAQLRLGGFYTRVTQRISAANVSPQLLLGLLIAIAALMSALLANDVVCLAVTPVLVVGCLRRGLNPLPYLLGLAFASNIGSAATLIGNPQNMLIGQMLQLDFAFYLGRAIVPVLLGLFVCWGVIVWLSRGRWKVDPVLDVASDEAAATSNQSADWPKYDHWQTLKGLAVLAVLVVVMLLGVVPRELAAITAAGILMCSRKTATREMLGLVDWQLLALFASLFVVNHSFQHAGLMSQLMEALAAIGLDATQPSSLFAISILLSNLVSNVPAVMLLIPAVQHSAASGSMTIAQGGTILALSSTMAGNLLLVGSIANIIVAEQARLLGVEFNWLTHLRAGVPVAMTTLALACLWLSIWSW